MMSNAEVLARLLQSDPLGAKLLCKDYENIEFHVSDDTITDICISQASCTYEIKLSDVDLHKFVTITITSVDFVETATWTIHCNEPLESLIAVCDKIPRIEMILEPRTAPSFDVLRRYAYKVHEYCKQVTSCVNCDFENKTECCPFRRDNGSGLCPSEWKF